MVNVGIVGIGFMGLIHYLAYQKARGARVAAICTRDARRRAGDWRGIQGNFGPPGEKMDLSGVATYETLEQLLADPTIDVVDLCLPPALHADATVAALRAGKHVFCEKPIALAVRDAERMVKAAAKADRQLFIGHVLPFFPEYDFARRTIESGRYGKLLGGHFKRIISDPTWLPRFYDPKTTGGPVLDLHVHDAHFIRLICGQPRAVFASGRMRGEVVEFMQAQLLFDDPALSVGATSGVIQQQGRAFTHGYEIHLERATLLFDFAVLGGKPVLSTPVTVLDQRGKVIHPKLPAGDPVDAFVAEIGEMCQALRRGGPSEVLGGELARDALRICQQETASVASGRLVKIG